MPPLSVVSPLARAASSASNSAGAQTNSPVSSASYSVSAFPIATMRDPLRPYLGGFLGDLGSRRPRVHREERLVRVHAREQQPSERARREEMVAHQQREARSEPGARGEH
jgi:hypothetical protein